jgi:CheY-like chemotaxis protein
MENLSIMIVEDEAIIAKNIKRSLTKNGFTVTSVVNSADQAIANAEKDKPDLVLMDIHLKGEKDGVYASEQIWKNFKIPIVFLTAHSDKETFNQAKTTLPFGYVTKPFNESQLCMAVEIAALKDKSFKREQELKQEINLLKGFLPICASCKRIRDDKGYWEQIELYISKRSEAEFSHGICPECRDELYGEFLSRRKSDNK